MFIHEESTTFRGVSLAGNSYREETLPLIGWDGAQESMVLCAVHSWPTPPERNRHKRARVALRLTLSNITGPAGARIIEVGVTTAVLKRHKVPKSDVRKHRKIKRLRLAGGLNRTIEIDLPEIRRAWLPGFGLVVRDVTNSAATRSARVLSAVLVHTHTIDRSQPATIGTRFLIKRGGGSDPGWRKTREGTLGDVRPMDLPLGGREHPNVGEFYAINVSDIDPEQCKAMVVGPYDSRGIPTHFRTYGVDMSRLTPIEAAALDVDGEVDMTFARLGEVMIHEKLRSFPLG